MGGPDGPVRLASVVSTSWRSTAALWRPALRAVIPTALLTAGWASARIARLLAARGTPAWRPATRLPGRRTSGRTPPWWPSGTGSRRRRRWMMRPAGLLAVPWPAPIIIAPVGADRERHDRQADHRAVAHHRHIAALIGITESPRIHPSAQGRSGDVTPLVLAEATHHANRD